MPKKNSQLDEKVAYIDHYPPVGRGVVVSPESSDFAAEVKAFCSKEHSIEEEEAISRAEKIIVVGDHSAGKTCLVRRYCENVYTEGYKATIGVDFVYKQFNILGREFTLHIWDTAGQEQFRSVSKAYFRGATGVILAFDLGDPRSFESTKQWLEEVKKENRGEFVIFQVGLKSDLEHMVATDVAEDQARNIGAEYWTASAKMNDNVRSLFERIAVVLFERSIFSVVSRDSATEIASGATLNTRRRDDDSDKVTGCSC
eukprot:TRINITY_DN6879_c0_g1_i2.p1 TRINITY_DN6879_c0_g1~~TRINITY_DN6879_c0_g1_i2.p1  ORF type:complete len:257 (-),score=46.91 TRINITY_DN6879_c0_g1_i2:494-1264(-)